MPRRTRPVESTWPSLFTRWRNAADRHDAQAAEFRRLADELEFKYLKYLTRRDATKRSA